MNKFTKKILIVAVLFVLPVIAVAQTRTDAVNTSVDTTVNTTDADSNTATTNTRTTVRTEISEDEQKSSVSSVVNTIDQINKQTTDLEEEIRSGVKNTIDQAIIDTRAQVDIQAYELRNEIDDVEDDVFQKIREAITNSSVTDSDLAESLDVEVETSINEIERRIESRAGVEISTEENLRSVKNTLLAYKEQIESNKALIQDRGGDLLDLDTDGDGLSDYDEVYIYNTDPENPKTVDGELTDAQKIEAGINPNSTTGEAIEYDDPREDETAFVSELYTVSKVDVVEVEGQKKLTMSGKGLPNSYVTVYVFSTPVVVTVKTDNRGDWTYEFDQELENGQHEVYVATVNNSGKLVARSNSIPFTKTAEAAAIGSFQLNDNTESQTFVEQNLELLILTVLLAAILITLMLAGGRGSKTDKLIKKANEQTKEEIKDGTAGQNSETTTVEIEGEDVESL
jgi:hypothetical protein